MMHATLASTDTIAASRLLIHAAGADGRKGWSIDSFLQRLRARVMDGARSDRPFLALEIRDLEGHRLLALDDAGPLVDVALPPGTYHVTTAFGAARRSYTVALAQGTSFDLYTRMTPQSQ